MDVLLWAYAYEYESDPLVSDAEFDETCYKIDLSIDTDRPDMDEWFRKNFEPYTGSWIYFLPVEELKRTSIRFMCAKAYLKGGDNVPVE